MFNYMDIRKVITKYYNPKDKSSEMFWRMNGCVRQKIKYYGIMNNI